MKKLSHKIIDFLKNNSTHELPKEGIIAGQSVAEAYFRIMNISIYTRIKDIDIFVAKNHNKKDKIFRSCERLSYDISFKGTTQELKVIKQQRNNYNDENGRLEFYDMNIPFERVDNIRTTYNIKNVFELENLNIIEIDTTSAKGDTTFLQNTIESFDINCIKIGLCIKSKVLYISKDFSDFLKTKQAQIVSYKSPVKTFTRLVEKKSYYKGVYFDLDYEVNMFYPLIDMGSNDFKKSISKEYYSKLSTSAKKDLSKYFILKEKEHCFLDKTKIYLNYEKITNSHLLTTITRINKIIKENKYATLIYPKFDYMVPTYNALTNSDLQNKYPILERLKKYISTNGKSIPLAVKNFRKNINLEWKRDYIVKTLKNIIVESNKNDEVIDNTCVDEFINNLQDKSITRSGIVLDSLVLEEFGLLGNEIDYKNLSLKMKEKLKKAREKGRGGWWNNSLCPISHLYLLYNEHTKKYNEGNQIDICNFAMFIWFREYDFVFDSPKDCTEINKQILNSAKNLMK